MDLLHRIGNFVLELLQVVIFAASIFLFVYLLILQPHKIKGSSMEPNFHNAEYLLTDKLSYRAGDPQRGDVIVFKAPPDYKEEYIKRIIGLPGDTVSIQHNTVFVNQKTLEESYLPDDIVTYPGSFLGEGQTATVPPESYFVMGDNREHSLDSRALGFIGRDKITGKAWVVYWPLSEAGKIPAADFILK